MYLHDLELMVVPYLIMVSVISAKLATVSDRGSVKWVLNFGVTFMLPCCFLG